MNRTPPREPGSTLARWHWAGFVAVNSLIVLIMFWPAITGDKILAPVDIAPNLFSKFRYVDPTASGVPANHYVIDLLMGDLSRNLLVHEAWQRGEMPWWDPYTDGGKPLAAEANAVNVSDPFKVLLFNLLPFEHAYNWVRIVPFLFSGLFAYALLRHFGFGFVVSVWGALLYAFAGCNFIMFSGPTVQASFTYFPLLWLLWDKAVIDRRLFWFVGSAAVSAFIFLSGNLQSHSYVFLFSIAFLFGYGWRRPERWRLLLTGVSLSLLLGLCLSAPFVLPQIEMFFLSARKIQPYPGVKGMLNGIGSLSALFPWALGTFRTLDLSKFFGQTALGFWIYIGSAALVIVALGCRIRFQAGSRESDLKRTALALVFIYLLVCSTPLLAVLYTRVAWLAVLGFIVLFAMGWEHLLKISGALKGWGRTVILGALFIAALLNIGGAFVYPRWQNKVEAYFLQRQQSNPSLDSAETLRRFQVANFPNEVTFKNPETLLAFLGLVGLGVFLLCPPKHRQLRLSGVMVLSTLPLLCFGHRYMPMHPLSLWHDIRAGGPEQRRVVEAARVDGLRVVESAPGSHELVFPGAMSQLFQVHVAHGHSSLMQSNVAFVIASTGKVDPSLCDYEYHSSARGLSRGELTRLERATPGNARFHWAGAGERSISITKESLTMVELVLSPGPDADMIRTDTYYPGWRVEADSPGLAMRFEPPCFWRIHVPAEVTRLRFVFEPRWLRFGIALASAGGLMLGVLLVITVKRTKRHVVAI